MIDTKDLVRFTHNINGAFGFSWGESEEYRTEIVARLRAFDELKEGIENMIKQICRDVNIARKSKGVDTTEKRIGELEEQLTDKDMEIHSLKNRGKNE